MFSGQRLRALREATNHTRESLSDSIGISVAQIVRHETDKIPSGSDIIKYAQYFGVSSDYLLGLTDEFVERDYSDNLNDSERMVIKFWRSGKIINAVIMILSDFKEP